MKSEDFLGYLYVTGQLEFLGKESDSENIVKCVNCDTELLVYEGDTMYCPRCNSLTEYITRKKPNNKKLSLEQKKNLINII